MRIYDETIATELALLEQFSPSYVTVDVNSIEPWPDGGNNDMIFGSDMAYELGSGSLFAVSEQMMTVRSDFVSGNSIEVYGPDLTDISSNISYGKIVLLKVKEDSFSSDDKTYDQIRAIQYTRYHIHPLGYMSRVSATSLREQVRVSKSAVSDKISFNHVGRMIIDAYSKYPQVKAVRVIFITRDDFDYKALGELAKQSEHITSALDHVLKDATMNCNSCNIKEICDEVEGMRELHFSTAQYKER
ncbi:MAG: carbon monoxide dehydrogenase [Pseudobutyrivibrio sp.]|nr:carbon monoxide dehydrogenase [Pseudobutyrivibrio sp.]